MAGNNKRRKDRSQVENILQQLSVLSIEETNVNAVVPFFDKNAPAGRQWKFVTVTDLLNLVGSPGVNDEFVKVTSGDTTAGYLQNKIHIDDTTSMGLMNPGANEKLTIRATNLFRVNTEVSFTGNLDYDSLVQDLPSYSEVAFGQRYLLEGFVSYNNASSNNVTLTLNIGLNTETFIKTYTSGYFVYKLNYYFAPMCGGIGTCIVTVESYNASGILQEKYVDYLSGSDIKQYQVQVAMANIGGHGGIIEQTITKFVS